MYIIIVRAELFWNSLQHVRLQSDIRKPSVLKVIKTNKIKAYIFIIQSARQFVEEHSQSDIRKQNDLKIFQSNKAKKKGLKQDRKESTEGVNN